MVFMLVAAPVIQLVGFGYAVNLDVDHIPTVVCDQDRYPGEPRARAGVLRQRHLPSRAEPCAIPDAAQAALEDGTAAAALIVPRGFARRLARRRGPAGAGPARRHRLDARAGGRGRRQPACSCCGAEPALPAATADRSPRILYNPRLSSPVYMLPGVAASLLLNVTAIITAMGLAREKETGTLEQILVTPDPPGDRCSRASACRSSCSASST